MFVEKGQELGMNSQMLSEYITYLWVLAVSLWGGLVSYFDKVKRFSWSKLAVHLSSSAFAGVMTYLLCEAAGVRGPMMGVLCGVSAHMGTPALIKLLMKHKLFKRVLGDEEGKE